MKKFLKSLNSISISAIYPYKEPFKFLFHGNKAFEKTVKSITDLLKRSVVYFTHCLFLCSPFNASYSIFLCQLPLNHFALILQQGFKHRLNILKRNELHLCKLMYKYRYHYYYYCIYVMNLIVFWKERLVV